MSMTRKPDAVMVGWQHYQAGRMAQAEEAARAGLTVESLTKAIRLQPKFAAAHTGLALALARLDRLTDAAVQFDLAARLQPNNASAQHNLGTVLLDMGRPGEAIPHFQKAVALDATRA